MSQTSWLGVLERVAGWMVRVQSCLPDEALLAPENGCPACTEH